MARERRPSRGRPRRHLKPRVIVVTEGAKTEPWYIYEFLRIHRAANVEVVGTGFDPVGVVEEAIKLKKIRTMRRPSTGTIASTCWRADAAVTRLGARSSTTRT